MKTSLSDSKVNYARITSQGGLVINVPDRETHEKTLENLHASFPENYIIEEPRKILSKLTIINVPRSIEGSDFAKNACGKDEVINDLISQGELLEVVKSWNQHGSTGESNLKNIAVKCSPKIHNYILNVCQGFIYLNYTRCKVFNRLFVLQCYHCRGFNHIAKNCPDSNKSAVCGKCAQSHETKACRESQPRCINCLRAKQHSRADHHSSSRDCPSVIREKRFLHQKTEYSYEKN